MVVRTSPRPATTPPSAIPIQWNKFPCLDFVDSQFNDHTGSGVQFDRLPLVDWQRAFLSRWGWSVSLPASARELGHLRRLRSTLRRFLEGAGHGRGLNRTDVMFLNKTLAAVPFIFVVDRNGNVGPEPVERDWRWIRAELARSAVEITSDLSARMRLKTCANPDCSWMFYDETMNRSRRWCMGNFCGNLVKVREFRARQRRLSKRARGARRPKVSPGLVTGS
jgi:predicted RNA-binding Zn ribbon-like protein